MLSPFPTPPSLKLKPFSPKISSFESHGTPTSITTKPHSPPPPTPPCFSASPVTTTTTAAASVMESSAKLVRLHGDLVITIVRARSLPNMDRIYELCHGFCPSCITPTPTPTPVESTSRGDWSGGIRRQSITSDPYVTVNLARATVARTSVIANSEDPVWNERFDVAVAHEVSSLDFLVKDNDAIGVNMIGVGRIPAARVSTEKTIDEWVPIVGSYGKTYKSDTAVHVKVEYVPIELNHLYDHGIAGDPEEMGIRNTYFPLRKGGMVKLYQDAHVKEGELPNIKLENGEVFSHNKCWEDIYHAIMEAQKLIYIVGWSVYHLVRLVRAENRPLSKDEGLTLGELLKFKSREGVRVCLIVWDDKTSHDTLFFKTEGVMNTHDEEIRKYFRHSSIVCVLSPRYASHKHSIFKQQVVGTLYTHHQKCVLVDTHAFQNKRKITAFIGGLDLCDGRYDTPEHRLFQDLDTVFMDDFHNPTFPMENKKGPRQPWHDLHCQIDGPAAYDILANFEQRWRKASKRFDGLFRRVSHWNDDSLIKLERISWMINPSSIIPNSDYESWHIQIFLSIDSGSVKDFPKTVKEARKKNLVCEKNLVIDRSIHTAYVQAIRSAKHFIYIENQYFIGSSYGWHSHRNAGADNLIPMEIALKIASKIRKGERFAVYIIIPMWPEGDPVSAAMQQILFWQFQTMQMMYKIIAAELETAGMTDSHPQDYLNFYCLGNREPIGSSFQSTIQMSESSAVALSQKFRRFMIYVHSKGMIVDDEYVLLGSANINQRSLDGSRDTEIAMGGYQPYHAWAKRHGHPYGQIYGYRMSLWREHLGMVVDTFKEPQNLDCVTLVNSIAEGNWKRYMDVPATKLRGHLVKYPLCVEADGTLKPIPGQETFPDVGGKVIGTHKNIPDALTT